MEIIYLIPMWLRNFSQRNVDQKSYLIKLMQIVFKPIEFYLSACQWKLIWLKLKKKLSMPMPISKCTEASVYCHIRFHIQLCIYIYSFWVNCLTLHFFFTVCFGSFQSSFALTWILKKYYIFLNDFCFLFQTKPPADLAAAFFGHV